MSDRRIRPLLIGALAVRRVFDAGYNGISSSFPSRTPGRSGPEQGAVQTFSAWPPRANPPGRQAQPPRHENLLNEGNGESSVLSAKPESAADVSRLVSIAVVGGLHHRYMQVAA